MRDTEKSRDKRVEKAGEKVETEWVREMDIEKQRD